MKAGNLEARVDKTIQKRGDGRKLGCDNHRWHRQSGCEVGSVNDRRGAAAAVHRANIGVRFAKPDAVSYRS
jgi:hypothetical protein